MCVCGCVVVDNRTQDSNLWVLALSYFAQKEENCRQQLVDVLTHILSLHSTVTPLLLASSHISVMKSQLVHYLDTFFTSCYGYLRNVNVRLLVVSVVFFMLPEFE